MCYRKVFLYMYLYSHYGEVDLFENKNQGKQRIIMEGNKKNQGKLK